FFFSSRRRHTRFSRDWSSDVCSSDLLHHNPRSDRHAMLLPTVHSDRCTGCGKCEQSCVLPGAAAIKVLPHAIAQGSAAGHYRKGWEEAEKAGGSLIGEQVQLPVRGLDDPVPATSGGQP